MQLKLSTLTLCACAMATAACSSSNDEGGGGDPTDPMDEPMGMDEPVPMDPPDSLLSDVLTGTSGTMPCDPLVDTEFVGDELCILPAEAGTGAFFHAGPSDYDDPEQIAEFTLDPGGESTEYYVVESNNDDMVWFRDQHYRMRPGSHHLIMFTLTVPEGAAPPEIGWHPEEELNRAGPLGGSQMFAMDYPEGGQLAPEDANLARPLLAHTRLAFELHYVNPGEDTILREAWVNLMNNEVPAEDRVILGGPFLLGMKFSVPPQTTQILNYEHPLPFGPTGETTETRIVSLFGHRHASTSRFSLWFNRNGSRDLVYEDFNWVDAREFFYNSVIENPTPDASTGTAGGVSGQQFLHSGDVLEWECEVTNTLDTDLIFGNGVYSSEMCNVFGTLTSTGSILMIGAPDPTITTP